MTSATEKATHLRRITPQLDHLRGQLNGLGDELYRLANVLGRTAPASGGIDPDDPRPSIDCEQVLSLTAGVGELTEFVHGLRTALTAQHIRDPLHR